MKDYFIEAAVGKPYYGYEVDYDTFAKKKKVVLGKEYSVVGIVHNKKDALKIAYRYAKVTPKKSVYIKDFEGPYDFWAEVLYTDNPRAFYYRKAIVSTQEDWDWRQLKYDGTVGKIIKRR